LRLAPSTVASYRKNVRLHVAPYPIAAVPLATLTGAKLTAHYRLLETSGRKDHREGEGLSARTVRYIATIVHAALEVAVRDGLLAVNPAVKASPPSAREARPPEMHPWTARQLRTFLDWTRENNRELHSAWTMLAMTGMRRGELLALRWRDIDLDAATVSVRRSAGVVRVKGQGATITEGPTKTGRPRVIDLDGATVTMLRGLRRERGSMALSYARDTALAFGDHEGRIRHPERFSRSFAQVQARCRRALADAALPEIRLHDLRHTHATLLLATGTPVKVVSERLGHASPTVTLSVYAHVLPGDQRTAAVAFAAMIGEA
jgi:integrase